MVENIDTIITLIQKEANSRREEAGYAGEYGDRGASHLLTQIQFYEYGRTGVIPPEWKSYEKEATLLQDTEYLHYLQLKRKFG